MTGYSQAPTKIKPPTRLNNSRNTTIIKTASKVLKKWQLYVMLMIPVVYIIVFNYIPMYGVQIAFKNFSVAKGIMESPWVGFKHFQRFFTSPQFGKLMANTIRLSVTNMLVGFPFPILLALMLNATRRKGFKSIVQTGIYIPYFISTVVLVGILKQMLSPKYGIINKIMELMGGTAINFMGEAEWFVIIYVLSDIWQTAGYTSIIYLAALTSINPELYDAASVDGATRMQKVFHIELPGIASTVCTLLIIKIGDMVNIAFEKVFLMQTPLNLENSEILSTYVYKVGIASTSMLPNYSYGAAIDLFNAAVSLILVFIVNKIVKRMGGNSLW